MILTGEALDRLREFEDASFDSCVTDPPYGLSRQPDMAEVLGHWLAGDDYEHQGGGFMGASWDSFVPGPSVWREVLRVLKPGGYLLAFGGSRTYDLLSIAIRLAGFEVRDTITWLYGSGFPKSRNIGKALDSRAGAEREVIGTKVGQPGYSLTQTRDDSVVFGQWGNPAGECAITAPATPDAARWEGWGTALKPAYEPIIVARKPFRGPVELNVLEHGTGALNIDASRVAVPGGSPAQRRRQSATPSSVRERRADEGRPMVNRTSDETYREERPGEAAGRFPPNVVLTHDPACNGTCAPGCPVALLNEQAGDLRSGDAPGGLARNAPKFQRTYKPYGGQQLAKDAVYGDSGSASRFFPTSSWDADELVDAARALYIAKASDGERNAGCHGLPERRVFGDEYQTLNNPRCEACGRRRSGELDDPSCECDEPRWAEDADRAKANFHPTVKPLALMRWLLRLVTPPGGRTLDQYVGSGTTAAAAALEGFEPVGIERDEDFVRIAEARFAFWSSVHAGVEPDKAIAADRARRDVADTGQLDLLGS